ncbi:MAG: invasion associated locus B family protein [Methylobacteriaceae bacterium]|nr:invasion associated locus B family protein [Methylobacteriaceae bacterium]MBV9244744.1 invasion associated locus B family protein [Methylobacteriaceae bacterium]MBV9633852.1 invasion associated locus B family protein [Methylobacteriaceae bacterium]MBV9702871.1 invasion associated locus B family protein [Methylobacteriaceae bacterium]
MRSVRLILLAILGAWAGAAAAQNSKPPAAKPAPATPALPPAEPAPAPGSASPPPGKATWASRCVSAARKGDLECSVEQSAVLKTGQIVVQFTVALPAATRAPVAIVQLPLGIFLPAGVRAEVDDQKPFDLPVETCDQRGCYATAPVPPELLAAMKSGKNLTVSFTTMAKEPVSIPLQLGQFAEAYGRIE